MLESLNYLHRGTSTSNGSTAGFYMFWAYLFAGSSLCAAGTSNTLERLALNPKDSGICSLRQMRERGPLRWLDWHISNQRSTGLLCHYQEAAAPASLWLGDFKFTVFYHL